LEVLRWQRALDAVLAPLSRRPLASLDAEVRMALRLGLVEMMRLELPAALATDGAVHLVKRLGFGSAAGLVNAVLRRAASRWRSQLESADDDLRLSHPEWMAERWRRRFGRESAEEMMRWGQEPARTWVWFVDGAARDRLAAGSVTLEPHPWCEGAWSAPEEVPRLIEAVAEGVAYAQDPSSQLVGLLARDLGRAGGRYVDLCAAPGGKSAVIAAGGRYGTLIAGDRAMGRARLMRPLLGGGHGVFPVAADALHPPLPPRSWDLVLLDAPCSGTGTLRRHPEIKWRLERRRVDELAALQRRLLAAAAELVAPTGLLIYATCSVEAEENEQVVEALEACFEAADLAPRLPEGLPWLATPTGGVRILPHEHGDGFTVHAFRRQCGA
jgi:16S rRNA (cytosine967-C5)-methyltransferase